MHFGVRSVFLALAEGEADAPAVRRRLVLTILDILRQSSHNHNDHDESTPSSSSARSAKPGADDSRSRWWNSCAFGGFVTKWLPAFVAQHTEELLPLPSAAAEHGDAVDSRMTGHGLLRAAMDEDPLLHIDRLRLALQSVGGGTRGTAMLRLVQAARSEVESALASRLRGGDEAVVGDGTDEARGRGRSSSSGGITGGNATGGAKALGARSKRGRKSGDAACAVAVAGVVLLVDSSLSGGGYNGWRLADLAAGAEARAAVAVTGFELVKHSSGSHTHHTTSSESNNNIDGSGPVDGLVALERLVRDLARGAAGAGVHIHVVCPDAAELWKLVNRVVLEASTDGSSGSNSNGGGEGGSSCHGSSWLTAVRCWSVSGCGGFPSAGPCLQLLARGVQAVAGWRSEGRPDVVSSMLWTLRFVALGSRDSSQPVRSAFEGTLWDYSSSNAGTPFVLTQAEFGRSKALLPRLLPLVVGPDVIARPELVASVQAHLASSSAAAQVVADGGSNAVVLYGGEEVRGGGTKGGGGGGAYGVTTVAALVAGDPATLAAWHRVVWLDCGECGPRHVDKLRSLAQQLGLELHMEGCDAVSPDTAGEDGGGDNDDTRTAVSRLRGAFGTPQAPLLVVAVRVADAKLARALCAVVPTPSRVLLCLEASRPLVALQVQQALPLAAAVRVGAPAASALLKAFAARALPPHATTSASSGVGGGISGAGCVGAATPPTTEAVRARTSPVEFDLSVFDSRLVHVLLSKHAAGLLGGGSGGEGGSQQQLLAARLIGGAYALLRHGRVPRSDSSALSTCAELLNRQLNNASPAWRARPVWQAAEAAAAVATKEQQEEKDEVEDTHKQYLFHVMDFALEVLGSSAPRGRGTGRNKTGPVACYEALAVLAPGAQLTLRWLALLW